jgi:hypothetical protein
MVPLATSRVHNSKSRNAAGVDSDSAPSAIGVPDLPMGARDMRNKLENVPSPRRHHTGGWMSAGKAQPVRRKVQPSYLSAKHLNAEGAGAESVGTPRRATSYHGRLYSTKDLLHGSHNGLPCLLKETGCRRESSIGPVGRDDLPNNAPVGTAGGIVGFVAFSLDPVAPIERWGTAH